MSVDTTGLAQAIVTLIDGLSVDFTADNTSYENAVLNPSHVWSPKTISPPSAAVGLPTIRRVAVEEGESQLGARDFHVEFPVEFAFDMSNLAYVQARAIATLEAFIDAVDADFPVDAHLVQDIQVTSVGPPEIDRDHPKPLVIYPATVELLKTVPS